MGKLCIDERTVRSIGRVIRGKKLSVLYEHLGKAIRDGEELEAAELRTEISDRISEIVDKDSLGKLIQKIGDSLARNHLVLALSYTHQLENALKAGLDNQEADQA